MTRISENQQLSDLRAAISGLERLSGTKAAGEVLPFGVAPLDRHLPWGGLRLPGLHELADHGSGQPYAAAAGLMAAGILARLEGPVLWVTERPDLYAPALGNVGLSPDRVLYVTARRAVAAVMEEALRHGRFAGVVGEVRQIAPIAARRLQLAAEAAGMPAFLLHRPQKREPASGLAPIAALTRWRIARRPSGPAVPEAPHVAGLASALWQLDLIRCRGAEAASWIVEACDATGHLHLSALLADGSLAPATAQPYRRAG
ncbi:ImuA family protein [Acidisoma silvae]|uniref:Damage-inducible mutagenesis protein n=1 Tax=Acidisoma silvae TaxID=2802396 RepID=A0A963YS68_9PROT|nr:damage-inducible mutagenesis protein [Acidisoma silvae]MCB8875946.1 damage-inducible mutagenesis protein [Acidisoma silvae]